MRWIPFVAYITLAGVDLVWLALDTQNAGMFAGVLPTIAAFLLAAPWSGILSLVAHDLAWRLPWTFVIVNAILLAEFAIPPLGFWKTDQRGLSLSGRTSHAG